MKTKKKNSQEQDCEKIKIKTVNFLLLNVIGYLRNGFQLLIYYYKYFKTELIIIMIF